VAYETADKGEKFSPRDHPEWVGKLFLIYPTELNVVQFQDDKGVPQPTDVVTADVAILDLIDPETGQPKVLLGARIAGKALVPQIKGKVVSGNAALGRLRQLPAQGAKSGAYVLDNEFTQADVALAERQDAHDWRGKYGTPAQAATPTGGVSAAPATPTPAPAAPAAGVPWFATDTALLTKLLSNGVANATTLDHATAQLIGQSFPG
jgi:hypothetical protein